MPNLSHELFARRPSRWWSWRGVGIAAGVVLVVALAAYVATRPRPQADEDVFRAAYAAGDYAAAAAAAERLVVAAPGSADAQLALASARLGAGDLKAARAAAHAAEDLAGPTVEIELALAAIEESAGDFAEVSRRYRAALEASGGSGEVLSQTAQFYERRRDRASAQTYHERALAAAPTNRDVNVAYGRFLYDGGLPEDALARVAPWEGEDAEAARVATLSRLDLGQVAAALASADRALELAPNSARALAARGEAELAALLAGLGGRGYAEALAAARGYADRAIAADPKVAAPYALAAKVAAAQGDAAAAARYRNGLAAALAGDYSVTSARAAALRAEAGL